MGENNLIFNRVTCTLSGFKTNDEALHILRYLKTEAKNSKDGYVDVAQMKRYAGIDWMAADNSWKWDYKDLLTASICEDEDKAENWFIAFPAPRYHHEYIPYESARIPDIVTVEPINIVVNTEEIGGYDIDAVLKPIFENASLIKDRVINLTIT